jgi:uncharacterized membrane protein
MSLPDKLARWLEAGLIDAEQVQRITAFESQRTRPLVVYAIAGLGGFAIAIGMLSIVAANWDVIPGWVKIGLDLAILGGLAWSAVRFDQQAIHWARETVLLVLFGMTLASIALVGQIYQLGGEARHALTIWTVLTALMMTRADSGWLGFAWMAGLQATFVAWMVWLADVPGDLEALALGLTYWVPLVCLTLGNWPWLRKARPHWAALFGEIGWAELVLAASAGTFALYDDMSDEDWGGLLLPFVASLALTVWLMTRRSQTQISVRALLVLCLILAYGPWVLARGELDLVAALSFIGLWLAVAFAAHETGRVGVLNLATAVIGIRIVIVYFEVFGSLLNTGVGLVTGGALTLALVWLWFRKRRDFAERDRAESGDKERS